MGENRHFVNPDVQEGMNEWEDLRGLSGRTAQRRAPLARPRLPAPHLRRRLMSRNTFTHERSSKHLFHFL